MKRIGIVTTSRADYGIYRPVLFALRRRRVAFELYVTGTHLHQDFGESVTEIEADGFPIAARIKIDVGSSPADVARAMGQVTAAFADVLASRRPDLLVVLGDRFEMHAMAVAAVPFGIPIAHIHGGELTQGAIDDMFRHSLTKLSSLHFASTREYAQRICQMGEESWRVVVSGAPGLVPVEVCQPFSKEELAQRFSIDLDKKIFLVTFHPETQACRDTGTHIGNLLKALGYFKDVFFVFTGTNADAGYGVINTAVGRFLKAHKNAILVKSMGSSAYLSMMRHAQVMVGNSSSGIIEAASFKLPVVNCGMRQAGRVRAANVIDVGYGVQEIRSGIERALSPEFIRGLKGLKNPYFRPDAAEVIADGLCVAAKKGLAVKKFKDIYGKKS